MSTKQLMSLYTALCCLYFISAEHFIGNYYVSHPKKADWFEASRFCTYYGMYLIDLPDADEYNKVLSVIQVLKNTTNMADDPIWTSGMRFYDEPEYYWETTGQPLIFKAWLAGDPHKGDQKCMALWGPRNYLFADEFCQHKHPFICRKKLLRPYCPDCWVNKDNLLCST